MLLTIVPACLTYLHLTESIGRHEICFVGLEKASPPRFAFPPRVWAEIFSHSKRQDPVLSTKSFLLPYGIYRRTGGQDGGPVGFVMRHASPGLPPNQSYLPSFNWPSIEYISSMLAETTSTQAPHWKRKGMTVTSNGRVASVSPDVMAYHHLKEAWCFTFIRRDVPKNLCFTEKMEESQLEDGAKLPPSGVWTVAKPEDGTTPMQIRISCTSHRAKNSEQPTINQTAKKGEPTKDNNLLPAGIRRNPNKSSSTVTWKGNETIQQIIQRPATTVLLLLNIYIAFRYWNGRVDPSSVAKLYSRMVREPYELWRAFSGATAHFEPLHIGFNMMALYAIGLDLEELYGSIPFFLYNASLIVMTSAVMMFMIAARIRRSRNEAHANTSSVGFSGVLFAWMVVTSLERTWTCPVPFAPDVCFETHDWFDGLIKFNFSPLIQLILAQFIMPRVSFLGHFSGILCGYFLHWGVLPLWFMLCPQVLVPGCFLLHLCFVRKIIPLPPKMIITGAAREEIQFNTTNDSGSDDGYTRLKRIRGLQNFVRWSLLAITILSLAFLDPVGTSFLTQCIAVIFYEYASQSTDLFLLLSSSNVDNKWQSVGSANRERTSEKNRSGTLWRGAILALTLVLVTDSMTLASWYAVWDYLAVERSIVGFQLGPSTMAMAVRIFINLIGLSLASLTLHDLGKVDGAGIFGNVFGGICHWTKSVGEGIVGWSESRAMRSFGSLMLLLRRIPGEMIRYDANGGQADLGHP